MKLTRYMALEREQLMTEKLQWERKLQGLVQSLSMSWLGLEIGGTVLKV